MARDSKFTEEEISILKEKAAEELQRSASASDPAEARGATALGGADHLHPGGRGVGRTWRTETLHAAAVSVPVCRRLTQYFSPLSITYRSAAILDTA
jgi:hypothetical protein